MTHEPPTPSGYRQETPHDGQSEIVSKIEWIRGREQMAGKWEGMGCPSHNYEWMGGLRALRFPPAHQFSFQEKQKKNWEETEEKKTILPR